jgi:hypothetical protein
MEPCNNCGKKSKATRGNQELKIYWARLRDIANQAIIEKNQFEPTSWHEYFKRKFIGCLDLPGGQVIGMSTSGYDDQEMKEYRWKVEEFASREFGVVYTENIEPTGRMK